MGLSPHCPILLTWCCHKNNNPSPFSFRAWYHLETSPCLVEYKIWTTPKKPITLSKLYQINNANFVFKICKINSNQNVRIFKNMYSLSKIIVYKKICLVSTIFYPCIPISVQNWKTCMAYLFNMLLINIHLKENLKKIRLKDFNCMSWRSFEPFPSPSDNKRSCPPLPFLNLRNIIFPKTPFIPLPPSDP